MLEEALAAAERADLRFNVGDYVQCRVGYDPVTGWADGRVVDLFYRENK